MLLSMLFAPLLFLASFIAAQEAQAPVQHHESPQPSTPSALRVAIIGAGAAGSSAAYHLRNYSTFHPEASSLPINITIFETKSRIGGRTTTVNALDDPHYPTELGASIFLEVNHILYSATKEFNLTIDALETRGTESEYSIGVWDGNSFVFRQAASRGGLSWWDTVKLLWRYGLAPIRTQSLMKSTVGRFLHMYDEPIFPFESLDTAAARVGLVDFTAATGAQILKEGGIGEKFSREIIQASTRVNYGQNLGVIHGLETMVCMATDGAMSVKGGNWQIFDAMVKASGANTKLNSRVRSISRKDNGAYVVKTAASTSSRNSNQQNELEQGEFDTIVLATPYQFSDISFSPPLANPPDKIPYVTLHVTLFTSPHRLSPLFFNLGSSTSADEVPDMVLTTLPEGVDLGAKKGKEGVGPAGFWSVSLLRKIEMDDGTTQYLYKVFSPEKLTKTWMSGLLGLKVPKKHTWGDFDGIDRLSKHDISWSNEKVWHSYPYELPRLSFERIRLEGELMGPRGIWYTSGIESFISTMETSALMGKNVARLIANDFMVESALSSYEFELELTDALSAEEGSGTCHRLEDAIGNGFQRRRVSTSD